MADPIDDLGAVDVQAGTRSLDDLGAIDVEPGMVAQEPIQEQHPDVGVGARQLIMFSGGDPEVGARYLRAKGLQVENLGGFNYAVKRPEEAEWRVLDPEGFDWQDILDVSGDVLSLGGLIAGGVAGGGSGGPAGGVGGAAVGTAAAQSVRSGLGAAMGLSPTTEETLGAVGEEALSGATAELGGRVIGGALRGAGRLMRKKPPAPTPSAPPPPGAATQAQIVKAIQKAGPTEEMVVGLGGQAGKPAAFSTIRKKVPFDEDVWDFASRQAARVAGQGKYKGKTYQETTEEIYKLLVEGKVPKPGRGELGPFVGMEERARQVARGGFQTLQEVTPRATMQATVPKTLTRILKDPKVPQPLKDKIDLLIASGPQMAYMNFNRYVQPTMQMLRARGTIGMAEGGQVFAQLRRGFNEWVKAKPPVTKITGIPTGAPMQPLIPTGAEVAFWKTLRIQDIQSLTLPDGTLLQLTLPQAQATKAVAQAMATANWTPKVKRALTKLADGLKFPKDAILGALSHLVHRKVRSFGRKYPTLTNIGGLVAGATGAPGGGPAALVAGLDIVGRGVGRVTQAIFSDTTGKALQSAAKRAATAMPPSLKRALQAGTSGNDQLYKAVIWGAMQQQDVQEWLQENFGSKGVNAEGPRVRQGYQGA